MLSVCVLLGSSLLAAAPAEPAPAPAFVDICLNDISPEAAYPSVDAVRKLFSEVKGHEYRLEVANFYDRQICQARGLFKLNQAWKSDTALRFSLLGWRWTRIYLWRGQTGVALLHYPNWNGASSWAAYVVGREGDKPVPNSWQLVAMDENRNHQIGMGPCMVMCHDKKVTLARGDVWLLAAPFEGQPTDVYFEMDGRLFGAEFVPCRGAPAAPAADPIVARLDKPAAVEWTVKTGEEATFAKLPDGAVQLNAKAKKPGAKAFTAIGGFPESAKGFAPDSAQVFCFQVDDPQQGTGIYLADKDGNEVCRLAFCRDNNKPELTMNLLGPGDDNTHQWTDLTGFPVAYAGKRQWVAILVGWGSCTMAVSPDGKQWSHYLQFAGGRRPPPAQIGVYCTPAFGLDRTLRLVTAELRRVENLPPQPAEGQMRQMLTELVNGAQSPAEKLAALRAVVKVSNTQDNNVAAALVEAYDQLVRRLLITDTPSPFSLVSGEVQRLDCLQRVFHKVRWDDALLAEAMPLIYGQKWTQVRALAQRLRLWQDMRRLNDALPAEEHSLADLSDWLAAMLPRGLALPRRERTEGVPYRPLLLTPSSKEGFNALSELLGAVQGKAYREACQVITGQSNPAALGLAPDPDDARLYYAYPIAVRTLMEHSAPLREAMEKDFARLGSLRLQAALNNGDREGMESVAVQFVGTAAASEARRWLGDQAVSSGRFAEAIGHYRHALRDVKADGEKQSLAARIRLAAALTGTAYGEATTTPVRLGTSDLPPDKFEQLVAELRQSRANEAPAEAKLCPPAGKYAARQIGTMAGRGTPAPQHASPPGFDWGGRQTGVAATARHLAVCDRAWLWVWNIADNKEAYSQSIGPVMPKPWPMVAARPNLAGQRVFVRRPTRDEPDVGCIDLAKNDRKWFVGPENAVASDPLVSGQDVYVFALRKAFPQKLVLLLCRLDAESGDVTQTRPVAEFLDAWEGELPCQAAIVDDTLVATAAGAVFCCHRNGTLQWIRQQVWIPPRDVMQPTRPWLQQCHEPPQVAGDRVLAFQPGMRGVECLELVTGRLLWQRPLPRIDRAVGVVDGRLIVRADRELVAVDVSDGSVAWRHAMPQVCEAVLCGTPGGVLYVKAEELPDANAPRRAVLVWLDAKSGKVTAESPVEGQSQAKPLFGQLVAQGDRLWLLVAPADKPQERAVWELKQ